MSQLNPIFCKWALVPGILLQLGISHGIWSSICYTMLKSVNVLLPLIRRFSSTFGSSWWTNMTLGDTCFPFPGLTECLFFSFSVFSSALLLDKTNVWEHKIVTSSCAPLQHNLLCVIFMGHRFLASTLCIQPKVRHFNCYKVLP